MTHGRVTHVWGRRGRNGGTNQTARTRGRREERNFDSLYKPSLESFCDPSKEEEVEIEL